MSIFSQKNTNNTYFSAIPTDLIAKNYGLKSLKILKSAGGISGENYFAIANDKEEVVIKYYRHTDIRKIKKIENTLGIMKAVSIPVPKLITNLEGNQHTYLDNSYLSIYSKIEGKIIHGTEFNDISLSNTASYLSKIHSAPFSSDLELLTTSKTIRPFSTVEYNAKQLLDSPKIKIKDQKIKSTIKNLIEIKLQILNKFVNQNLEKNLLPCNWLIHGDFHNQNLLFDEENNLKGILDFENAHLGHPTEDIMHFISLACCNTGYQGKNLEKASFFLQQYLSNKQISVQELELGWYMYLYHISSSFFLEEQLLSSVSDDLAPFIERDIKNLGHLYSNMENVFHDLLNND